MTGTTHSEFGHDTEGSTVAQAFADRIRGKTILITGVNRGGLGYSAAHALASQGPALIIITGRNPARVQASLDSLKTEFPAVAFRSLLVDLSSQKSVRASAAELLSWADVPHLDLVLNSAGVMGVPERTLTEDGIEMHFATNHIGHWLLTCLIAPKLIAAAAGKPKGTVRVVNLSSGSPFIAGMRWSDINFDRVNKTLPAEEQPVVPLMEAWGYQDVENQTYIPFEGYNQSKVANVLFGIGATKRLYEKHGVLVLTVHPGVIKTDLGRDFPQFVLDSVKKQEEAGRFKYKSFGAGGSTGLVAMLDPQLGPGETVDGVENHGAFLADCQIAKNVRPVALSSENAERLWKLSESLVKEEFSW